MSKCELCSRTKGTKKNQVKRLLLNQHKQLVCQRCFNAGVHFYMNLYYQSSRELKLKCPHCKKPLLYKIEIAGRFSELINKEFQQKPERWLNDNPNKISRFTMKYLVHCRFCTKAKICTFTFWLNPRTKHDVYYLKVV
jgi:hypothetical protein